MKRLGKHLVLLLGVTFAISCAASKVKINSGAERISVSHSRPSTNYENVGSLTAQHGHGCGGFGSRGNYEGAVAILKNKALEINADHITIEQLTRPHKDFKLGGGFNCFHNEYIISGTAYKKINLAQKKKIVSENVDGLEIKLTEAKRLYDKGLLSDEEFKQLKKKIISEHKLK